MARGRGHRTASALTDGVLRGRDRFTVATPERVESVANEAHRRALEVYARAMTSRRDITVRFGEQGSWTDMDGNIVIQSNMPAEGTPGERYVCIAGLLSHELWHERITARTVFVEIKEDAERAKADGASLTKPIHDALAAVPGYVDMAEAEAKAAQLAEQALIARLAGDAAQAAQMEAAARSAAAAAAKLRAPIDAKVAPDEARGKELLNDLARRMSYRLDHWNIIEDGRIEEHARAKAPLEYRRISLLNRLAPRITDTYTVAEPMAPKFRAGDPAPLTSSGAPLEVVVDAVGTTRVLVPAGTTLPVWTERPIDPVRQMRGALLAEAVPEFSATDKPLHPAVRACLEECLPIIDRGVTGDTRTALAAGDEIIEVLKRHGLMPEVDPNGGGGGGGSGDGIPSPFPGKGEGQAGQPQRGDGGGTGEGTSESAGGAEEGEDGGDISSEDRERNEQEGKGSAGEQDVKDAVEQGEGEANQHASEAGKRNAAAEQRGDIPADRWKAPGRQAIHSQVTIRAEGSDRLDRGRLSRYGNQLADELAELRMESEAPIRFRRTGRLDRPRLARAVVAMRENPDARPRAFYKQGEELETDLAADITVDLSGSMDAYRQRLSDAAGTAHIACEKLGMPHAIWGYDSGHSAEANHYEFKGYDEIRPHALGEIGNRSNSRARAGGGTPTKSALEFALARLSKRQEGIKINMILTDGQPTDSSPADCRRIVDESRRRGNVVIGIFFRDRDDPYGRENISSMREIFGADLIEISDIAEMPRALGKRVKSILKTKVRGTRS